METYKKLNQIEQTESDLIDLFEREDRLRKVTETDLSEMLSLIASLEYRRLKDHWRRAVVALVSFADDMTDDRFTAGGLFKPYRTWTEGDAVIHGAKTKYTFSAKYDGTEGYWEEFETSGGDARALAPYLIGFKSDEEELPRLHWQQENGDDQ